MSKKTDWRKFWQSEKGKQRKSKKNTEAIVLTSTKIGDMEIEIPLLLPLPKNSR